MRVLKDKILQRTKVFNLPALFDLLTLRLEAYYEARVTDVALGRWEMFQHSRFLAQENIVNPSDIEQVGEKQYRVKGTTPGQTYTVDMHLSSRAHRSSMQAPGCCSPDIQMPFQQLPPDNTRDEG
ncbi:hypothetical protein J4Q44_G00074880 [Coregonus suidteri]|uniref:Uncharacterized protein n=1 Tax=Coregonus suidteri TaxID=861788 RepID=A0AAN8N924_9TELE